MSEASHESHINEPRAEVVKKIEVNGRELVVLKASPRYPETGASAEGGEKNPQVFFVEGHNLKPKKVDDQVRIGFDIGVIADSIGCDVYSVIRSSEGADSTRVVTSEDAAEGVALTKLHRAKAQETLGAIQKLQDEGVLTREPLDVMGFSDGGIVTLAMLDEQPQIFQRFILTNTPGLDNVSTAKTYAGGLREAVHLVGHNAHKLLQRLMQEGEKNNSKLTFRREEGDGYAKSTYMSKPSIERHAIAKTRNLLHLLPNILHRNPNLQGYIVSTENDKIAPAIRVENQLRTVLKGDPRITARRTGWKMHALRYGTAERVGKLQEQAEMLIQLRGNSNGGN